MLYDVRHEEVVPVEIAFFKARSRLAARWPDKKNARHDLPDRRVVAHQYDDRGRGALTNNRLRRVNIQRAAYKGQRSQHARLGNLREPLGDRSRKFSRGFNQAH